MHSRAKNVLVLAVTAAAALFSPRPAAAQDVALSEILTRLVQADIRLAAQDPNSAIASHDAHFIPGEDQQLAPFFFNQSILSQLSTFPVGSSSGGFSYTFDASLGTFVRSTDTFGPSFAERAVTIGRNRTNLGATYQHVSYDSFEGQKLQDGDIKFYLTHEDVPGDSFFEGDIVQAALRLNLSTDTIAMFGNYGVTDRFDIGVTIPLVHVDMDASIDASVLRLASGDRPIHQFPDGSTERRLSEQGQATGIGDILVRSKYQLVKTRGGGLAAAADLRLPSGDDRNLLGTGATQLEANLIGSAPIGFLSPHFNVGYTWSEDTSASGAFNVSDEVGYAAGTEIQAHQRLTLLLGVTGRTLRQAGRLQLQTRTFNFNNGPAGDPATRAGSASFLEFGLKPGNLNLTVASVGFRFNPMGNMLISANLLLPIGDAGIKANPTPVIGLDYVF